MTSSRNACRTARTAAYDWFLRSFGHPEARSMLFRTRFGLSTAVLNERYPVSTIFPVVPGIRPNHGSRPTGLRDVAFAGRA